MDGRMMLSGEGKRGSDENLSQPFVGSPRPGLSDEAELMGEMASQTVHVVQIP